MRRMQCRRTRAAIACAGLLLAACAPDAIIPSQPYDAFLTRVGEACRGKPIGAYTVDQLARRSQSKAGNFFMDQTSRLYFGRLSAQDWTTQVSAFLRGWPQDPGIDCVLREYNAVREWTTPTTPAKQ